MEQALGSLTVHAQRQGLVEITDEIAVWLAEQKVRDGLLTVFIRHTSASLLIQENVDPEVQRDLEAFLMKLVPESDTDYQHDAEGPDDMPAHIKGALTQTHLGIPVGAGRLMLGRYQGIFLFEHRRSPRPREIVLHLMGQKAPPS
ncbi:MAG TPA: secondary thiamine-phosphate synthase enzyme YjbQ [Reyranella sp.]|jgi:secondary thiamine-phosphate synthase enzyme|nr:secondary thiamine-phosphate synthase enzyme YjbQ [Reyranella sp.]